MVIVYRSRKRPFWLFFVFGGRLCQPLVWSFLFVFGSPRSSLRAPRGFCFFGFFGDVGFHLFIAVGKFLLVYGGGQRLPFGGFRGLFVVLSPSCRWMALRRNSGLNVHGRSPSCRW